jgi:hypothetical protein
MLNQVSRSVYLNESSEPISVIITNTKLTNWYDDKIISSLIHIQRGSTILYNNNTYMVISQVNDRRYGHYKANMRLLPHSIVINRDCKMQTVPCYTEENSPSLKGGQVMTILDNRITVNVPSHKLDTNITLTAEFMINGNKFKIINIDDYTQKGISILTCEREQINPELDDVKNNIAGGLACKITPPDPDPEPEPVEKTIKIVTDAKVEGDHVYINFGQTKTFTATILEGETPLSENVVFEFYNDDKTSPPDTKLYTATINGNVVSIKANSNSKMGYFQIRIISVDDMTIEAWQRVRIKGFL